MLKVISPQRARNTQRFIFVFLCALCVLYGLTLPVFAQDSDELMLSVRRDWGFGGGSQIQGLFTMEATGPSHLVSVTFKIDDTVVGEVTSPPFKIQFDTDDYPAGWHNLTALGKTIDGHALTASARRFEFVSADYAWSIVGRIILVVGGSVGALMLFGIAVQFLPSLLGKKPTPLPLGAPQRYGLKGGAICLKCHRPYSIHLWSFNFGARVLDYCSHCGKWSLMRRATPGELAAAESAELVMAQPETPVAEATPEEKLKRQLDESRYVDGT